MTKPQIDRTGLRKRPTFEGILDYLASGQEKVKFPDRRAKFIRNHPYLTQLDGEGMYEMEEQQEKAWREQEKEHRVKEMSSKGTQSAPELRTETRKFSGATSSTKFFDIGKQDADVTEEMDITSEEFRKRGRDAVESSNKRRARAETALRSHMEYISETSGYTHFAAQQAAKPKPPDRPVRSRSPLRRNDDVKMKQAPETSAPAERKRVLGQGSSAQPQAPKRQGAYPPSLPRPPSAGAGKKARTQQPPPPPESASDNFKPPAKRVRKTQVKVKQTGTVKDTHTDPAYWQKKGKGYIVDQLSHRGYRDPKAAKKMKIPELIQLLLSL